MLLRQLEYLVALAREEHFARAAAACFVSQPSLSAGIRKLESDLDVPLVQHGARFEGLTPEGERVLRRARRILSERDALQQELAEMRGQLTGTLRLGAIPTAMTVASLLTTPFCERHRQVTVGLESLSSRDIMRRLAEFEIDAALTYLDDEALQGVRKFPLYEERYLLLTPVDGPYATQTEVSWAQAAKLPLVLLPRRMRNRRILDEFFAAEGVAAFAAVETDTLDALYAHLASGRWSSVISHAWLHMFGIPDGMRVVRLGEADDAHRPGVGLVVTPHARESAMVRALLTVAGGAGVRDALDTLLEAHLES
ncbi:LysR family transcriptional regulator [Streptomyces sp. HNM0575]|uniref:LysR family transcriptional regulator n=1 Tax=Streptomyces sp. HNM0575 TaxID=2716338 RepID=UPI00145C4576|nr:LysR family transcriptional regulator [Streptomyces sp. HNM0575]NLU75672.1 LysR family transcriptional regulator [Streptomyces sp. HNM0575]